MELNKEFNADLFSENAPIGMWQASDYDFVDHESPFPGSIVDKMSGNTENGEATKDVHKLRRTCSILKAERFRFRLEPFIVDSSGKNYTL